MAALREGADDVTTETRTLRVDGAEVPIIHARTDGLPRAGLVVAPDIMGVRPLFEEIARRLASHGLAVAVVEPFARVPDRADLDPAARMSRIASFTDEDTLGDLAAAADLLVVEDDVARVSVLGFCMGGYFTLKAAATDRFDAAVPFYGMLRTPEAWRGPGLAEPLDLAGGVCPTLAIFGSADPYTPPDDIDALRAAWAGRDDCEVVVVDGADHGFVHDPDRPAHRSDDAAAMWARALAFILPS